MGKLNDIAWMISVIIDLILDRHSSNHVIQ